MAMYVMPKALESLWVAAHGKASPSAKRQMMSEAAFLAAAMGMVMVSPILIDASEVGSRDAYGSQSAEHVSK